MSEQLTNATKNYDKRVRPYADGKRFCNPSFPVTSTPASSFSLFILIIAES